MIQQKKGGFDPPYVASRHGAVTSHVICTQKKKRKCAHASLAIVLLMLCDIL